MIAAAVVPVWLFAAYLIGQYALNERQRYDREAVRVARLVALVVEGELNRLLAVLEGLAKSEALAQGDLARLHAEAVRLVEGTERVIVLRDLGRRQLFNTSIPFGEELPPAPPMSDAEAARFREGRPLVGNVYPSPISGEIRVPVALPVEGPQGEALVLALTVPTTHIRNILVPAAPAGWTIGIGDGEGRYVARSVLHDETTGRPGLPEYLQKVVGTSGVFTSRNFQGLTLLAGYFRSGYSGWFYTANIPLSVVQAPVWNSVAAIVAIALLAMTLSAVLAYVAGKGFTRAAGDLAAQAEALGAGRPVAAVRTTVAEFDVIANAMRRAEGELAEREHELKAVLETVPAAVWFTYDPKALQVIRNRFAAELMGIPIEGRTSFGTPDLVVDTLAFRDGETVPREERPLTRAMRGAFTDGEEYTYIVADGTERVLLTSARPIQQPDGAIVGAVQVSLDITERKRGEEQRKLLVNELNHRVKNTLAVVQSIAAQTLRSAAGLAEAEQAVTQRLASLARAHDILTQESWRGADLGEIVHGAIARQAEQDRIAISGPPVWLPPSLALSIALALHELTTNAIKHGALSVEGGTVAVSWRLSRVDERRHLSLEWRESGGPPVLEPKRKGFGTRLLGRLLDAETNGEVELRFEPAGVVCILEADLPEDPERRRPDERRAAA